MAERDVVETVPSGSVTPAGGVAVAAPSRYVLLEPLGEGGMGQVWAAYDRTLDRKVAYKILHDHLLGDAHQQRLIREARAMARLSHPNVVPVYDVGEDDGRTFLTMEFVAGRSLDGWLDEPRGWAEIAALFRDVAAGLAAAHDAGVIHRDVKPSNVLVGADGRARVADFGVARDAPGLPGGPGGTTGIAGSPAYMAPEQLRGETADGRSDQFGLCVSLYEALHGRRPFAGETLEELAAAIAAGPPAPVADVPAWLHAACARGLAADPAARFPSMEALGAALAGPPRREGRRAAVIAAAAAVAAIGATLVVTRARREGPALPRCDDAGAPIDQVWTPARRAALVRALAPGGTGPAAADAARVAAHVDAYAGAWRARAARACRAARIDHTLSPELAGRTAACLASARRKLDATTGALAAGGTGAAGALDLVGRLDPLVACGDPDYLRSHVDLAPEMIHRGLAAAIEQRLDALDLQLQLDRTAGARGALARARALARIAGLPRSEAFAVQLEARLVADRSDYPGAAALHREAYRIARAAHDPVAAAQAASSLVLDLGYYQDQHDRAADWAEVADAEAVGLPGTEIAAVVERAIGVLDAKRGHARAAAGRFSHAAATLRRVRGPGDPAYAKALGALGNALGDLGQPDLAIALHHQEIAILEAWAGPDAAVLCNPLDNVALDESDTGHDAEAEADARRALAIARARTSSDDQIGTALLNLGSVLTNAGKDDDAIPPLEEARERFTRAGEPSVAAQCGMDLAIARGHLWQRPDDAVARAALADLDQARADLTRALGADHPRVLNAITAHASLLSELDRCPEAIAEASRAIASYERRAPTDPRFIAALEARGRCLLHTGRPREALADLERETALAKNNDNPVADAFRKAYLGQALVATGARARGLSLLREARGALHGDSPVARSLIADVDRVLAANAD